MFRVWELLLSGYDLSCKGEGGKPQKKLNQPISLRLSDLIFELDTHHLELSLPKQRTLRAVAKGCNLKRTLISLTFAVIRKYGEKGDHRYRSPSMKTSTYRWSTLFDDPTAGNSWCLTSILPSFHAAKLGSLQLPKVVRWLGLGQWGLSGTSEPCP